ncbi:hypothetical protein APHAL10511_004385 [Amanita phalloides]|nr:hypothetical protein APHAL10511_004385 [Amanita phalloides]
MDVPILDRHILDWDESDVHSWLAKLGYPHYEVQIREHKIRGDILIAIDSENLKLLGVSSIGHRLAILKGIYFAKASYGVTTDDDTEILDRSKNFSLDKFSSSFEDQGRRLRALEEENRQLNTVVQALIDDFNALRGVPARTDDASSPLNRQPSFKWAQYVKPQKSPTKLDTVESPHSSPQQLEHDFPSYTRSNGQPPQMGKPRSQPQSQTDPNISQASSSKPNRQESTDTLKSFKVSLDDPTWKVLPAALKKYRITNDTWQNYAMFICFGPAGNRAERCLSYDEKPLLLFQKLKDAQKNPVFMLKHIKDIRSPIAVAEQKHAARKLGNTAPSTPIQNNRNQSTTRATPRPPKLEVQDFSASTPLQSSLISPHPGWPDPSSPTIENQGGKDNQKFNSASLAPSSGVSGTMIGSESSSAFAPTTALDTSTSRSETTEHSQHQRASNIPIPKDPSGVVDADPSKQGWVPAGCLLETNVPVASAIAEATAAKGSSPDGTNKTPILPLSIISTSYPGVALMDYKKKGDEELDLVKDDALRVFKRYNHWSYAVKEDGGDRGWVPSWFIGKVATNSASTNAPQTSASATQHGQAALDETAESQVSPLSSAFPAVQTRS